MSNPARNCHHCGLPLNTYSVTSKSYDFCCYGCLLANQITGQSGEDGVSSWLLIKLGLSLFFAMNVLLLSYTDYIYHFQNNIEAIINYIQLVLTIPVIVLLGFPILKSTIFSFAKFRINIDTLIVIGSLSAFMISIYSTYNKKGPVYLDTVSMLLVLVTLGRYLEANAKANSTKAINALLNLIPDTTTILKNGIELLVGTDSIVKSDIVKVSPGERIPVDGEVIEGMGSVDESNLTGESTPVIKEKGSLVYSSTINLDGVIIFRATEVGDNKTVSRLAVLLKEARDSRAPIERIADKITSIFVPGIVLISALTFIYWFTKVGINPAVMNALSVLVISCPCALGIATPMAIRIALGRAAREGILIRSGEILEKLSHVNMVLFDKTGTLTKKELTLSSICIDSSKGMGERDIISLCSSLQSDYEHPLAKSIMSHAITQKIELLPATGIQVIPGMGIRGKVNQNDIFVGSLRLMMTLGLNIDKSILKFNMNQRASGSTVAYMGINNDVVAVLSFQETIRSESASTIANLKGKGIDILLLTGDNEYAANIISKQTATEVRSNLKPEDKISIIQQLKNLSKTTAMVGDGINDAPALNAADIGIVLGCGADITRESADISLLNDDLTKIPWVISLARITRGIIKQNLFWAFIYNSLGIGVAVIGWMQPVLAAVAMIISSLIVLSNSLRTGKIKIESETLLQTTNT